MRVHRKRASGERGEGSKGGNCDAMLRSAAEGGKTLMGIFKERKKEMGGKRKEFGFSKRRLGMNGKNNNCILMRNVFSFEQISRWSRRPRCCRRPRPTSGRPRGWNARPAACRTWHSRGTDPEAPSFLRLRPKKRAITRRLSTAPWINSWTLWLGARNWSSTTCRVRITASTNAWRGTPKARPDTRSAWTWRAGRTRRATCGCWTSLTKRLIWVGRPASTAAWINISGWDTEPRAAGRGSKTFIRPTWSAPFWKG